MAVHAVIRARALAVDAGRGAPLPGVPRKAQRAGKLALYEVCRTLSDTIRTYIVSKTTLNTLRTTYNTLKNTISCVYEPPRARDHDAAAVGDDELVEAPAGQLPARLVAVFRALHELRVGHLRRASAPEHQSAQCRNCLGNSTEYQEMGYTVQIERQKVYQTVTDTLASLRHFLTLWQRVSKTLFDTT